MEASRSSIIFPGLNGPPNHPQSRSRPVRLPHSLVHSPEGKSSPTRAFSFPRRERQPHRAGPPRSARPQGGEVFPKQSIPSSRPPSFFEIKEDRDRHPARRPLEDFPPINDNFGNSVGPDFGPVILEPHSGPTKEESFFSFGGPITRPSSRPHISSSPQQRFPFTPRPKPFKPSKPFATTSNTNFGELPQPQNAVVTHARPGSDGSQCNKYTDTICLDAPNYPQ